MFTRALAELRALGWLVLLAVLVILAAVVGIGNAAHHAPGPVPCPVLRCGPCNACAPEPHGPGHG